MLVYPQKSSKAFGWAVVVEVNLLLAALLGLAVDVAAKFLR